MSMIRISRAIELFILFSLIRIVDEKWSLESCFLIEISNRDLSGQC